MHGMMSFPPQPQLPAQAQTRSKTQSESKSESESEKYEHENVHRVYDQIAAHFSETRYKVCTSASVRLCLCVRSFFYQSFRGGLDEWEREEGFWCRFLDYMLVGGGGRRRERMRRSERRIS